MAALKSTAQRDIHGLPRNELQAIYNKITRADIERLSTKMTRLQLFVAFWGLLMIVISTASLAVLLYAVLE